ncbi:MAG TPA: helix-turn-helix transcriptional regulator [Longimicrobium sp.]|jgi:hypothetical protein|uniref:helix-turn-helix domain-containing protein n=1 Tax=Longimicrobium sp. TaxID=2029185 RepID=UPI002ED96A6C
MAKAIVRGAGTEMRPDEVRAARQANGWNVEELADALWVTPLEAEAWEAGSVAPSPREARWIRWHAQMGVRDRALADAGLNPCAWVRERLAQRPPERRGNHLSDPPGPEIALHVEQCSACCARPLPDLWRSPVPEPPRSDTEGIADWLIRRWRSAGQLSLWPRLLARVIVPAGLLGAGLLLMENYGWADDGFNLPLEAFLAYFAGYLALLVSGRPLRNFAKDHPYLAWQVRTAAVLYSMLVVCGSVAESLTLNDPGVWVLTGIFSLMIGGVAGAVAADAQQRNEYLEKCVALTLQPMAPLPESGGEAAVLPSPGGAGQSRPRPGPPD